jgi:hypothetical protein
LSITAWEKVNHEGNNVLFMDHRYYTVELPNGPTDFRSTTIKPYHEGAPENLVNTETLNPKIGVTPELINKPEKHKNRKKNPKNNSETVYLDWQRSGPVQTVDFFGDRLKKLDHIVQYLRTAVRSQKYWTRPFSSVFLPLKNRDR